MTDDAATRQLVDGWARDYSRRTGHPLYEIDDHGYTYVFDIEGGRVVCVSGRSTRPDAPRDLNRQKGSPPPRQGDHRGHIIAHSMGGGMDINLIKQEGRLNLSPAWRAIERYAADHPGTAVAVHLRYEGNSDRPSEIEYAHSEPHRGLIVQRFENREPEPAGTAQRSRTGQGRRDRREVRDRGSGRDPDSRDSR